MNQGKRDDQIETSMMFFVGGLIGIIACLVFSLVAVVVCDVWSSLCG